MSGKNKMVLPDDSEAAVYRTDIKGWVSAKGLFFGDGESGERAARWNSATHVRCADCGDVEVKHWTHCARCRQRRRHERWLARPVAEWDGDGVIYSEVLDRYLDEDEVQECVEEHGELDLVRCEPVKLRMVEADYWEEELREREDGSEPELPVEVENALERLNEAIAESGPISWEPGRYRVECERWAR